MLKSAKKSARRNRYGKPKAASLERLALAIEEAGEFLQVAGKILRHGYDSRDPTDPACPGNRALLEKEAGDILHAIDLLVRRGDLRQRKVEGRRRGRQALVARYLHWSENWDAFNRPPREERL